MKYKSYKKTIAMLIMTAAVCVSAPLISRAADGEQPSTEQTAEQQPQESQTQESQPAQENSSQESPSQESSGAQESQPQESQPSQEASSSGQTQPQSSGGDSSSSSQEQPKTENTGASQSGSTESAAQDNNSNTSSGESSTGGTTESAPETKQSEPAKEEGKDQAGMTAEKDKAGDKAGSADTASTAETASTESSKEEKTDEADTADTEEAEEADTESEEETKDGEKEDVKIHFSGLDGISAKNGETVDLLSGVSVTFEKPDGTTEEKTAYIKSVTDQDGNSISISGSSLTVSAGKTYTVTYGVDGAEDTASRTVTVQEKEFKADVQFKGLDTLTVDAESDTDVAKGVTAVYKDKDGNEQKAEVSIKSISVDGSEIGTDETTDAAYRKDNTLCNAQSEKTYKIVFKNSVTDQTAERTVNVRKKVIHVDFSGTDDTTISADIDYVLTSGVSASYTDRSGKHNVSVVVKKVTDKDGNTLDAGATLKSPESEQVYTVTYGTDATDETAARKVTVKKAEYEVKFKGTDDLTKADGDSADLMKGVSAEYEDLAGKTHDVNVSVKSVEADGKQVSDKKSETDAYLDGDTLMNLQAGTTYAIVYENDKTDDTAKRTITVSDEYLDSIDAKCGDLKVTVSAKDTLVKGDRLLVERDSVGKSVRTAVKDDLRKDKKVPADLSVYSLEIKDKKGKTVELPDDAKVTFTFGDDTDAVLYAKDKSDITRIGKGTGRIAAKYSSEVVMAETEDPEYVGELTAKCGDAEVILTADEDVFTKGSTAKVEIEKDIETYADTVKKSDEKNEKDKDEKPGKIESVNVYDVTILDADGDEYDPEGSMSITFKDAVTDAKEGDTVDVYQFKDGDTDKMEKLDTKDKDGKVRKDTDALSVTCKTNSL